MSNAQEAVASYLVSLEEGEFSISDPKQGQSGYTLRQEAYTPLAWHTRLSSASGQE